VTRFDHPLNPHYLCPVLTSWVDSALRFWSSIQLRSGSFNEYYPFEAGYPPTAFSLYAAALVLRNRGSPQPEPEVGRAVQKACDWLLRHPERQALNQEAAGLAGLGIAAELPGIEIDRAALQGRLTEFLGAQHEEGWFPEYGGPDPGYLSVTIDCLCDLYETTGDKRLVEAATRAVGYLTPLVSVSGQTPVMVNSRNTDYVVPYGLVRLGRTHGPAAAVVRKLLAHPDRPSHYLSRTDDRYACHYVYQSAFRCLAHLNQLVPDPGLLPCEKGAGHYLTGAGLLIRHRPGRDSVYVAGRKGGVTYVFTPRGVAAADFGWRLPAAGGKVALTHWQDPSYEVQGPAGGESCQVTLSGNLSAHGWLKPTPFRHMVLRLLSLCFGRRLIPLLKQALIFRRAAFPVKFERRVEVLDDRVVIDDRFTGGPARADKLSRAPHSSLRHVSSAGQFLPEELLAPPEGDAPVETGEGELVFRRTIPLDGRRENP